jgi:hypothetical protein
MRQIMNSQLVQRNLLYSALSAGLLLSSYGCGGGGGGSSATGQAPAPAATAPQPTPVIASGVITGFSSVFVNGERYEVESDTVVDIEDAAERVGDDSDLRIGMKVRIRAEEDGNGVRVAQRIEYDEDLKGPARNVTPDSDDPRLGTFEAVGVAVIVDANTVFDDDVGDNNSDGNVDIRDLEITNGEVVVEVSGLPGAAGIVATRIDRVNGPAGVPGTDGDEYEVKGFVLSVAGDGGSFVMNGATFLVVSGAGGTTFEDGLVNGSELVGVFVEVKADENAMGEYVAVAVEREDDIGDRDDDGNFDNDDRFGDLDIEGILVSVSTSADPDEIVINGITIQVADASSLVGLEGARVEIEGSFDDNGVLTLREVEIEREHNVRIEDRVAEKDPGAGTITTRLGLVVEPTGLSRVEDDAADSDDGDHLTPSEFVERVQPGDYLEARGVPNTDGSVTWARVERDDDDDLDCELRGPVESIDGTDASSFSFEIQGVTIDVSQITSESSFGGIGRQNFFDNLDEGDVVEAESDEQGVGCENGRLTAREVEFENDDGVFGTADDGNADNGIVGTPEDVTENSFVLGGRSITVNGSTLIDDSIIERALGQEFGGDDQRFDQIPGGLTLTDLLPGTFPVEVEVNADEVALRIEDL